MTDGQRLLTQTLSTGLRSWELPCDHVQPTHRGETEKRRSKPAYCTLLEKLFE